MNGNNAEVTFVLVTYNSEAVIGGALASVAGLGPVVVVDNASTDRSVEIAAEHGAHVLRNADNAGFGTACNQGAAVARTPYIFFLNPDARVLEDAVPSLLSVVRESSAVAAAGPILVDPHGRVEAPRMGTLLEEDGHASNTGVLTEPTETGFLSGAALLVDRAAFQKIRGFDEQIFLYLEDDDLCLRLRVAGYELRLVPGARIEHAQGTSTPPSLAQVRFRNGHTLKSQIYLAKKHNRPFDKARHIRKAWQRVILGCLTFDRERIFKNIGRLEAMGSWPGGA